MAISRNMVVDYGADNTGVGDVTPDFYNELKPDMAGQDCILTIPAGTYTFNTFSLPWAGGMTSLAITATGATLQEGSGGGVGLGSLHMTQRGIDEASGQSARIQSAAIGATSVTLTPASASAGHISRANVGRWMLVAGFNIQDQFQSPYGWPPNFHFIDFVQITAINGNTISFTPALQNFYSDQWPEVNRGSGFEGDAAGSASVFFLHPDWDHVTTVTDGTYINSNLIKCEGKTFVMNGGDSSIGLPIFPTVNKNWKAINHTANTALVEHDKINDLVEVEGGTYKQWHCQSSSTRELRITGASIKGNPTATDGGINGTPRNTYIDNCDIGYLGIGPTAYGRADTFRCTNSTIAGGISGGVIENGPSNASVQDYMTMTNGVITIPRCFSEYGIRCFPPDPYGRNVCFWSGNPGPISSFAVLSVTADPWPALDDQTSATNVSITSGSKSLSVSSSIFTSGDVGKVIIIPGAGGGSASLRTYITAFTSDTQVTLYHAAGSTLSASSRTIRWGTCNSYIQTNQSGGFPSSSLYGTKLSIKVPAARAVYFENCVGNEQAVDLSQAAARDRPLDSYTKREYRSLPTAASNGFRLSSAGALAGAGSKVPMVGNIQSIKFNVTRAYTGVQGTLTAGLGQFQIFLIIGGSLVAYNPRINMKITGERVITIGNVTGAQTGDANLSIASPAWIPNGFDPVLSANINSEDPALWPIFTIEMITDQGFSTTPTAVMPLRFRLRAA